MDDPSHLVTLISSKEPATFLTCLLTESYGPTNLIDEIKSRWPHTRLVFLPGIKSCNRWGWQPTLFEVRILMRYCQNISVQNFGKKKNNNSEISCPLDLGVCASVCLHEKPRRKWNRFTLIQKWPVWSKTWAMRTWSTLQVFKKMLQTTNNLSCTFTSVSSSSRERTQRSTLN